MNDTEDNEFRSSFTSQSHFEGNKNEEDQQQFTSQGINNPNGRRYGFRHNSKILAFFTSKGYRGRILNHYHDEILL